MRRRLLVGPVTAGLAVLCLCSCETTRFLAVRDTLIEEAESHFARGQYQPALLKYSAYLFSPEPSRPHKALALYRLGYCQFALRDYRDAENTLGRFIDEFPADRRRPEAEEWLAKSRSYREQEVRRSRERVEMAVSEIAALQEGAEQEPQNAELHFRLGEVYWRMGQFAEALEAYRKAIEFNPEYLQHPSIRKRVIVRDDASLALRESLIIPEPTGPIRVRNIGTKRVERSDFWGVHPTEYAYVVSGEVINVGDRTCVNVQVEVTIYDFYGRVMDARIANIGTMRAGQRRHFVAELNRFAGDPLDIRRYETQVFYEER